MDLSRRVRAALASATGDPVARHVTRAAPYLATLPPRDTRGPGLIIGPADMWLYDVSGEPWYETAMAAPDEDRISLGITILERLRTRTSDSFDAVAAPTVLAGLAQIVPAHGASDRHLVLSLARRGIEHGWHPMEGVAYAAAVLEGSTSPAEAAKRHATEIKQIIDALSKKTAIPASDLGRLRARLLRLIGQSDEESSLFDRGDAWGVAVVAYLDGRTDPSPFRPLLLLLGEASTVSPTRRWKSEASELLRIDGSEELIRVMVDASFEAQRFDTHLLDASPFQPANANLVRGAYWAAGVGRWDWVSDVLGRAGLYWALSGRNDNYARDQRLANTTVALLADLGTPEAVAALGLIAAKVRNRTVARSVATTLDRAATSAGMTSSELVELNVPRLGLDEDGRRVITVGSGTATIAVDATGEASIAWSVGGRVTATAPKALVDDDKAAVARAKADLKEIRTALSVERGRLEDLLMEDREWAVETWVARYRHHPLTAAFAERLIWRFRIGPDWIACLPTQAGLLRPDGTHLALDVVDRIDRVAVWHPIHADAEEIRAWRRMLLDNQIRQPFKQAFREVYLLTPAEEATGTYSNRFAGHVLDYPVARALMGARRWGTNFLGPFDGGLEGIAKRDFRSHGIRAEFSHDAIEPAGLGAVPYCSTDQVRFVTLGRDGHAIPLRDVPPVVFSEAMLDVDLFVGVSSIAADVNWQDAGRDRDGRFEAYWQRAAFGELTASAESRREALAWMVPQLTIADRLTLEDRYLRVRGDRRTYRIHLGSANILMEPNDQYLCIVPGRGASASRGRVFLPFDDDHRLSVILSKAFLLAHDRKITDPSILSQIGS